MTGRRVVDPHFIERVRQAERRIADFATNTLEQQHMETRQSISTEALRKEVERSRKHPDSDLQRYYEDQVLTLCDALDAARAEIERVRTLLVLERRERPDKYGPDYRGDGSWEIAREALGEEKQR